MELAKITSKGQITLPINIRRALNLKDGDKVAFVEMNGQYVLTNPTMLAIRQLQTDFAGFAEENGLQNEDDVVAMVKEIRAESPVGYKKLQATVKLLAELSKGVESIRSEGGLSVDEAFAGLTD